MISEFLKCLLATGYLRHIDPLEVQLSLGAINFIIDINILTYLLTYGNRGKLANYNPVKIHVKSIIKLMVLFKPE